MNTSHIQTPIKAEMDKKTEKKVCGKKDQQTSDATQKREKGKNKNDKGNKAAKDFKLYGLSNKSVPEDLYNVSRKHGKKHSSATEANAERAWKVKSKANNVNDKPDKQKRLSKTGNLNIVQKSSRLDRVKSKKMSEGTKVDENNQTQKTPSSPRSNKSVVRSQVIKNSKIKSVKRKNRLTVMKFTVPYLRNEVRVCDVMRANMENRDCFRP